MSIITSIVKPLDNGYVQVDSTEKNGYTRHFKVPGNMARSFSDNLKHHDKSFNIYSNVNFWTSIILGLGSASYFTRNLNSTWMKFFIQTASAIGLTSLTSHVVDIYRTASETELINKHNAKEIYYKA